MRMRSWQAQHQQGGHQQAGFSLIETVVALVLFASMFVLLNRGLSTSWQGVRSADMNAGAVALATAQLASAGIETPLVDGMRTSGQQGPFSWDLTVSRYVEAADGTRDAVARDEIRNAPGGALTAYWVGIEVSWPGGPLQKPRSLRLRTLKRGRS